jgi:hypothetical protein
MNLHTALQQGIRHRQVVRALPMPKGLSEGHAHNASIRGGMFQAQIYNQPIHHPRRPNCSSHRRTGKDLTNGVPLQVRNNTADKLCKLQEILEQRTDGNDERKITAPMQQVPILQQSPRLVESDNHDPAAVPMVAREYAMLPRVLKKTGMDTTDRSSPQ